MSLRSSDLEKMEIPWERRDILHTFEDGFTIERLHTANDLVLEGGILGHCAVNHAYWVANNIEYLFSLRNPKAISKATIHTKPVEWWKKSHEKDTGYLVPDWNYGAPLDQFRGTMIDGVPCGLSSTYYDNGYIDYSQRITFDEKELVVISVHGTAADYTNKCYEWLNALGAHYTVNPTYG